MKTKYLFSWLGVGLLILASGCAVCGSPYDEDFAAYGGVWQRTNPSDGRVGSVVEPAGDKVLFTSAEGAAQVTEEFGGRSVLVRPNGEDAPPMPDWSE